MLIFIIIIFSIFLFNSILIKKQPPDNIPRILSRNQHSLNPPHSFRIQIPNIHILIRGWQQVPLTFTQHQIFDRLHMPSQLLDIIPIFQPPLDNISIIRRWVHLITTDHNRIDRPEVSLERPYDITSKWPQFDSVVFWSSED